MFHTNLLSTVWKRHVGADGNGHLSERKEKVKGFFVSLGALFEKHGAAQTGILTNKSHYKETRSFEYFKFPA